jgi:hypothetical protein
MQLIPIFVEKNTRMSKLNEKLSKLATDQPSDWKAKAKYRRDNRLWLKKSAAIAIKVLDALDAQGLTQKDLAERMGGISSANQ